jgi:hypothetical protein
MRFFVLLPLAVGAAFALSLGIKSFLLINSSSSLWPVTFALFGFAVAGWLLVCAVYVFRLMRSPRVR